MAIVDPSGYQTTGFFKHGHFNTIYANRLRSIACDKFVRERIPTPDDDFLDIDWIREGHKRIVVLSHGLEGNSRRLYIKGMAKALTTAGFDICAWNYRSCSGVNNNTLRLYHHGATDDLDTVVRFIIDSGQYESVHLVGFSMGGSLMLNYLGGYGATAPADLGRSVAISAPTDIWSAANELARKSNYLYMRAFLQYLKRKIQYKAEQFPDIVSLDNYDEIRDFYDFDTRYTAPLHGFKHAYDYWQQCSANNYLDKIKSEVLILNAKDDPFLGPKCYPYDLVKSLSRVWLETPENGGHVGFVAFNEKRQYWSEQRVIDFLNGKDESNAATIRKNH
jgi:predicted alpha/beta-fold hydrolase